MNDISHIHTAKLRNMKHRASKYKKRCSGNQQEISRLQNRAVNLPLDHRHIESDIRLKTTDVTQLKRQVAVHDAGLRRYRSLLPI